MVITTGLLADFQSMAAHRPVAIQFIDQFVGFISCNGDSSRKLYVEIQHDILIFQVVQLYSHGLLLSGFQFDIPNKQFVCLDVARKGEQHH